MRLTLPNVNIQIEDYNQESNHPENFPELEFKISQILKKAPLEISSFYFNHFPQHCFQKEPGLLVDPIPEQPEDQAQKVYLSYLYYSKQNNSWRIVRWCSNPQSSVEKPWQVVSHLRYELEINCLNNSSIKGKEKENSQSTEQNGNFGLKIIDQPSYQIYDQTTIDELNQEKTALLNKIKNRKPIFSFNTELLKIANEIESNKSDDQYDFDDVLLVSLSSEDLTQFIFENPSNNRYTPFFQNKDGTFISEERQKEHEEFIKIIKHYHSLNAWYTKIRQLIEKPENENLHLIQEIQKILEENRSENQADEKKSEYQNLISAFNSVASEFKKISGYTTIKNILYSSNLNWQINLIESGYSTPENAHLRGIVACLNKMIYPENDILNPWKSDDKLSFDIAISNYKLFLKNANDGHRLYPNLKTHKDYLHHIIQEKIINKNQYFRMTYLIRNCPEIINLLNTEHAFEIAINSQECTKAILPIFSLTSDSKRNITQFTQEQEITLLNKYPQFMTSFYGANPPSQIPSWLNIIKAISHPARFEIFDDNFLNCAWEKIKNVKQKNYDFFQTCLEIEDIVKRFIDVKCFHNAERGETSIISEIIAKCKRDKQFASQVLNPLREIIERIYAQMSSSDKTNYEKKYLDYQIEIYNLQSDHKVGNIVPTDVLDLLKQIKSRLQNNKPENIDEFLSLLDVQTGLMISKLDTHHRQEFINELYHLFIDHKNILTDKILDKKHLFKQLLHLDSSNLNKLFNLDQNSEWISSLKPENLYLAMLRLTTDNLNLAYKLLKFVIVSPNEKKPKLTDFNQSQISQLFQILPKIINKINEQTEQPEPLDWKNFFGDFSANPLPEKIEPVGESQDKINSSDELLQAKITQMGRNQLVDLWVHTPELRPYIINSYYSLSKMVNVENEKLIELIKSLNDYKPNGNTDNEKIWIDQLRLNILIRIISESTHSSTLINSFSGLVLNDFLKSIIEPFFENNKPIDLNLISNTKKQLLDVIYIYNKTMSKATQNIYYSDRIRDHIQNITDIVEKDITQQSSQTDYNVVQTTITSFIETISEKIRKNIISSATTQNQWFLSTWIQFFKNLWHGVPTSTNTAEKTTPALGNPMDYFRNTVQQSPLILLRSHLQPQLYPQWIDDFCRAEKIVRDVMKDKLPIENLCQDIGYQINLAVQLTQCGSLLNSNKNRLKTVEDLNDINLLHLSPITAAERYTLFDLIHKSITQLLQLTSTGEKISASSEMTIFDYLKDHPIIPIDELIIWLTLEVDEHNQFPLSKIFEQHHHLYHSALKLLLHLTKHNNIEKVKDFIENEFINKVCPDVLVKLITSVHFDEEIKKLLLQYNTITAITLKKTHYGEIKKTQFNANHSEYKQYRDNIDGLVTYVEKNQDSDISTKIKEDLYKQLIECQYFQNQLLLIRLYNPEVLQRLFAIFDETQKKDIPENLNSFHKQEKNIDELDMMQLTLMLKSQTDEKNQMSGLLWQNITQKELLTEFFDRLTEKSEKRYFANILLNHHMDNSDCSNNVNSVQLKNLAIICCYAAELKSPNESSPDFTSLVREWIEKMINTDSPHAEVRIIKLLTQLLISCASKTPSADLNNKIVKNKTLIHKLIESVIELFTMINIPVNEEIKSALETLLEKIESEKTSLRVYISNMLRTQNDFAQKPEEQTKEKASINHWEQLPNELHDAVLKKFDQTLQNQGLPDLLRKKIKDSENKSQFKFGFRTFTQFEKQWTAHTHFLHTEKHSTIKESFQGREFTQVKAGLRFYYTTNEENETARGNWKTEIRAIKKTVAEPKNLETAKNEVVYFEKYASSYGHQQSEKNKLYVDMPLVKGTHIDSVRDENENLDEYERLKYTLLTINTLEYFHKYLKIFHGDIKPENMINSNKNILNEIILIDGASHGNFGRKSISFFSEEYAAPELETTNHTIWTDRFAAGVSILNFFGYRRKNKVFFKSTRIDNESHYQSLIDYLIRNVACDSPETRHAPEQIRQFLVENYPIATKIDKELEANTKDVLLNLQAYIFNKNWDIKKICFFFGGTSIEMTINGCQLRNTVPAHFAEIHKKIELVKQGKIRAQTGLMEVMHIGQQCGHHKSMFRTNSTHQTYQELFHRFQEGLIEKVEGEEEKLRTQLEKKLTFKN